MKRVNHMKRSFVIFALSAVTTSCVGVVVNTAGSARDATEAALMQADRDFAVATHARGIDGWMSFYASDAIRIRYRDNIELGTDRRPHLSWWLDRLDHRALLDRESNQCGRG